MSDDIELPDGPVRFVSAGPVDRAHERLTEAGIPANPSIAVRVGLLIDERNSLRDELEGYRERERIADRSGYAFDRWPDDY